MSLLANRYEILEELGRGTQGVVYRVLDRLADGQEVALKRIEADARGKGGDRREATLERRRLRLREEFRAMARLQHPNTLTVHDYGELSDGVPYLTMELVEGRELAQLLAEGPLDFERIVGWLVQILQALGFIHSRLYVHRDVKSANVRVQADGAVKLMDFGLMYQLGTAADATRLSGTPAYMAPELIQGGMVTPASDLYAVGCLAYELVTGSLPFQGKVSEVVRAQLEREAPPLRYVRPETPEGLERVVSKLMAKEVACRYARATEVIDDLCALTGLAVPLAPKAHRTSYLVTSGLVAREAELKVLSQALESACGGRSRAVLVGAPAGVGKSRLVREATLQAKLQDVTVLEGQCLESGMAAYEPLAQVLRPLVALSTPEEIARYGPVLARVLPELGGVAGDHENERRRVNYAVAAWLRDVGLRRPLVVMLDDLHWSDPRSLEVFNHAIMELTGERDVKVLFLATFRSDETPVSSPIHATIAEGASRLLPLEPFTPEQVEVLLTAMLQEVELGPAFAASLHETTRGNAFFVTEVVRCLLEDDLLEQVDDVWRFPDSMASLALPATIQGAVLRRFAHMGAESRRVARAAAVLGRFQDRDALLATSGMGEEALFAALDELVATQFLLHADEGYTFLHDRVREALYADTPEGERRELHQRYGDFLLATQPDLLGELAYHFGEGTDAARAYEFLRRAGDHAMACGLTKQALEKWVQADGVLAGLARPDREEEQAALWWDIGFLGFEIWPVVAVDALERLLKVLEAAGPVDRLCAALRKVGGAINRLPASIRIPLLAHLTRPVPYRHKRRGALPPNPTTWIPRVLEAQGLLATAYAFSGDPARGLAMAAPPLARLPFQHTPLEGALLVVRCGALYFAGQYDELVEVAQRATQLLFRHPLPDSARIPLTACVGATAYQNGVCYQGVRPHEGLRDVALQAAERIGALHLFNMIRHNFGLWAAWTGRQADAEAYIDQTIKHCRQIGAPTYEWVLYLRPYLSLLRGDVAGARAGIDEGLRHEHLEHSDFALQFLRTLDGQIALAEGRVEAAEATFKAVEARGRAGSMHLVTVQGLLGLGEVAIARESWAAARIPLRQALDLCAAGPARNPLHEALAHRHLGRVALAERELDAAEAHFAKADAIVRRPEQDNLLEQARLLTCHGELALARGEASDARKLFQDAATRFGILGLTIPETRARERLTTAERRISRAITTDLPHLPWQVTRGPGVF